MKKNLDTGKDKIKAICDIIRKETLLPAEEEGEKIIHAAHAEAKRILDEASAEMARRLKETHEAIQKEKNIFNSSLSQDAKQALETFRQKIVDNLFAPALYEMISEKAKGIDIAARLISLVIESLEKEGLQANVEAYIGKSLDPKEVAKALLPRVLSHVEGGRIEIGDFQAGIEIRQKEKKLKISINEDSLYALLADSLKNPEFRKILFREESRS